MSCVVDADSAEATRLATLWNRLATQHVALACSCLMGGVSVTLEDFERDIADWLCAESERLGHPEVSAFLLGPGPIETQDRPVRRVLERLEAGEAEGAVAQWLLERMARSIESYARLHGPSLEAPLMGGSRVWRGGYRD